MISNKVQRILVVDDDETIRQLVELMLENEGFEVNTAASGEDAFSMASRHLPDLAILDVMMPQTDGYTLCRRLRANESTRLMPIMMLTSQADTSDKLEGFKAGADDYLTKPFEPAELVMRVRALLARSQMPSAAEWGKNKRGKLFAVFGAKGGVGKTTVAVNLAVAFSRRPKTRVALVDADFSFGDVGAQLNLAPSRTILDLITRVEDIDSELLRQVMIRHESNVHVLLAPLHPEDAERILPEALRILLYRLADWFDYVIADLPTNYDDRTLTVLECADEIIYVLTPEMGPVKNTSMFMELANKMGIPLKRLRFVLNRANSDVGIAPAEIERALSRPIPMRLVSGGRSLVTSVNRGVPVIWEHPKEPFAQQITRAAEYLAVPQNGRVN